MRCPKCGAKLRAEQTFSQPSGLTRQGGGGGVALISGVSCWCCGYWRDAEIEPVMAGVPMGGVEPGRDRDRAGRMTTQQIVAEFYDSIRVQRSAGASWDCVAKLLTQSGNRVNEKTLQKYFLLEQGKRCGDEKAAEV